MTSSNTREYRVTRYASIEVKGREFRVINEVVGDYHSDIVYPTYAAAKDAAYEISDSYYHTERRAGWR